MIRSILFSTAVLLAATSSPALAQTREGGGAITIESALNVSAIRPMMFAREAGIASSTDSPAVIEVTGDPGRVYRIYLPEQLVNEKDQAVVDRLMVVSETSGDVSAALTARMGPDGRDRLRISGRLRQFNGLALDNVTTAVPVRVDYE